MNPINRLIELRQEITKIYLEDFGNPAEVSADSVLNEDISYLRKLRDTNVLTDESEVKDGS
jgi:hypothetical protein